MPHVASAAKPIPPSLLLRISDGLRHTYLSAGDGDLDLTAGGGDEGGELLNDAGEEAESVVLGEGVEEVLDGLAGGAGLLDELLNDGGLVGVGQGRGGEDGDQLGVLLEEGAEVGEGVGRGVEARGLDGSRVLN